MPKQVLMPIHWLRTGHLGWWGDMNILCRNRCERWSSKLIGEEGKEGVVYLDL
jgi:hypothetical protein